MAGPVAPSLTPHIFTEADPATATADGIAAAIGEAVRPNTRAVGITWVQSSNGLRIPVRPAAEVVHRANASRRPADRCLPVVDDVHGLAAVDEDAASLGGGRGGFWRSSTPSPCRWRWQRWWPLPRPMDRDQDTEMTTRRLLAVLLGAGQPPPA
ncbi:hypothetical protein ACFWBN_37105 [Streptomyces sp. NPDC059989]|uniref:hypothetical protein n=1 Tax=Streptomyces sp. NPDC059989 TaxID=3347026 RepID=UPI0036B70C70